ncbi:phasin family protein [Oricola sp.]|uniref:phasin family protein n=1 Tax=Oricola sp. TaxID=1979950 RepID=UPI003BAB9A03
MNTFEDANKIGKEMMDNSLKSYAAMTKSLQSIASEASDYSKKSYEQSTAAFEKLAAAKTLEAAMEVQTEYAKTTYEAFVAEATKMSELFADMAKEAYKPYETAVANATK